MRPPLSILKTTTRPCVFIDGKIRLARRIYTAEHNAPIFSASPAGEIWLRIYTYLPWLIAEECNVIAFLIWMKAALTIPPAGYIFWQWLSVRWGDGGGCGWIGGLACPFTLLKICVWMELEHQVCKTTLTIKSSKFEFCVREVR